MNYDYRLVTKGVKKIYYFGYPINYIQSALIFSILISLLYKYVIQKNFDFFQGKGLFIVFVISFLVLFMRMYKKRCYIQWDEKNIRFKNINGYSAIIGVDNIKLIEIKKDKGIYITHENFYDEKMNGTYLIPFEGLGRNYNTDVDLITDDFKKTYPTLIKSN